MKVCAHSEGRQLTSQEMYFVLKTSIAPSGVHCPSWLYSLAGLALAKKLASQNISILLFVVNADSHN